VLVYNEDQTVFWEGDAPERIIEMMKDSYNNTRLHFKKFFHAHLEDGKITLDEETSWQDW